MRFDYGYEEEKLGKQYDLNLLKKLYRFGMPYRMLFFSSAILVILITLLDLSIPYVTKIAIDRYIVPQSVYHKEESPDKESRKGFYRTDLRNPDVRKILEKHGIGYNSLESFALVPIDVLSKMSGGEILILRKNDFRGVGLAAAALLAIVIASFFLNFLDTMLMEYAGQMIMHDLRMRLFKHIQSLPVAFFSHNPVGRLVTRVTSDIQNMDEFFTSVIAVVFKDIFLLAGIMIVLLGLSWKLALVSFTVLPIVLFISFRFSGRARDAFRTLRIKVAEINSKISETIGGIRVLQLFLQEKENKRSFEKLNHENYVAGMRQIKVLAVFLPVIELLGSASVALVIYYGGRSVLSEELTIGALVAFISYMKMFFRPIRDIAEKYNVLQNAMSSAERIFLILDNKDNNPEFMGEISNERLPERIESVEFRNVSFSYVQGEPVLKEISFTFRSGEKIAVVGPTGTGKTTVLNLLMRFYEPDSGTILINGKEIKSFSPDLLRSKMAVVMQDSFLFSGTVGDNISRGKNGITKKEVEHILDVLNCRNIIERLPDGIDTVLSEGGKSISSGERQLISIARAFARNPGIIMLDEATSYVDSETERRIEEALAKLMEGRTSIIIAHRLTTAHRADRIMVLNKGRLIESGAHDELMKKRGFYYRLNTL
jgi:ATP-binding cassette subfamily B protein